MSNHLIKKQQEALTQITNENWLSVWQQLPVKADMLPLEILQKSTPELSTLNRGTGSTENSIMMLEAVVLMLLEFYGVEWSELQVRETAELWSSEYYWLHIAEIKHFLTKCKTGKYGKVFGKFSASTLMEWLGQYAAESMASREELFTRKNEQYKYHEEKYSHNDRQSDRDKEQVYRSEKLKDMQAQILKNMNDESTNE